MKQAKQRKIPEQKQIEWFFAWVDGQLVRMIEQRKKGQQEEMPDWLKEMSVFANNGETDEDRAKHLECVRAFQQGMCKQTNKTHPL